MMLAIVEIVIITALILVNGLFSMAEIAIVSARKVRLQQDAEEGDKGAISALQLTENPSRFLSTIQIWITLIGILSGAFGGATIAEQIGLWLQKYPLLAPYSEIIGVTSFMQVLRRYPDLPANIPHMGGLEFEAFGELLDTHPSLYLDTSYSFVPGTPYQFPLGRGFIEAHRDRILYGSDFPNVMHPREAEINHLLDMRLSGNSYSKVFRENGLALLPTK